MDGYKQAHNTDTKILMTEAYTTIEMKQKFYGSGGRKGAEIPFNFQIIDNLNTGSTAADYKTVIDSWLLAMPKEEDYVPNWVVS
jgi:alpha-glucosidase